MKIRKISYVRYSRKRVGMATEKQHKMAVKYTY